MSLTVDTSSSPAVERGDGYGTVDSEHSGPDGFSQSGSDDDFSMASDGESLFDIFTGNVRSNSRDDAEFQIPEPEDQPYVFPPLQGPNDIRIMVIQPADDPEQPVVCSIEITSLEHPCHYQTLSYPWGPTSADGSHLTDIIYCDGMPIGVTFNLNAALKRIRLAYQQNHFIYGKSQFKLWVDAICINQANATERGSQVMLMDRIYGASQCLLIRPEYLQKRRVAGASSQDQVLQEYDWSNRRWVVQELLLSPVEARWILWHDGVSPVPYNTRQLLGRNSKLVQAGTMSLLNILQTFHDSACADPRDRVYALIKLSSDLPRLIVDYTRDLKHCYLSVAKHYLTPSGLPELLAYAASRYEDISQSNTTSHEPRGLYIPSWIPDWRMEVPDGREETSQGQWEASYGVHAGYQQDAGLPYQEHRGSYHGLCVISADSSLRLEGFVIGPCNAVRMKDCKCGPFTSAMHHRASSFEAGCDTVLMILEGVNSIFVMHEIRGKTALRADRTVQLAFCLFLNSSLDHGRSERDSQVLLLRNRIMGASMAAVEWDEVVGEFVGRPLMFWHTTQTSKAQSIGNRLAVVSRMNPLPASLQSIDGFRDLDNVVAVSRKNAIDQQDFSYSGDNESEIMITEISNATEGSRISFQFERNTMRGDITVVSKDRKRERRTMLGGIGSLGRVFTPSSHRRDSLPGEPVKPVVLTHALFDQIAKEQPDLIWSKTKDGSLWEDGTMHSLLRPWEKTSINII